MLIILEQPQHLPRSNKLITLEWLCEAVSRHLLGRNILQLNVPILHMGPEPVVTKIKVLHASMVLWVLANSNSRLVVYAQGKRSIKVVAKLTEEVPQPQQLLRSSSPRDVLSLSGGQCLDELQST